MKRAKYGTTVSTRVCWSMISDTHTAYASRGSFRHGRSRRFASNHGSRRRPTARRTASACAVSSSPAVCLFLSIFPPSYPPSPRQVKPPHRPCRSAGGTPAFPYFPTRRFSNAKTEDRHEKCFQGFRQRHEKCSSRAGLHPRKCNAFGAYARFPGPARGHHPPHRSQGRRKPAVEIPPHLRFRSSSDARNPVFPFPLPEAGMDDERPALRRRRVPPPASARHCLLKLRRAQTNTLVEPCSPPCRSADGTPASRSAPRP